MIFLGWSEVKKRTFYNKLNIKGTLSFKSVFNYSFDKIMRQCRIEGTEIIMARNLQLFIY